MNFYSDDIINKIIDNSSLENIIDELDDFKKKLRSLLHNFSGSDIHYKYIDSLLGNEQNKTVFYCIDFEFSIDNCPVMMIYRKKRIDDKEIRYYILMLCTKHKFRNQGYASKLLDGFIEQIKNETPEINKKVILSSIESAVLFYESYGFKWTRDTLSDHTILMETEKKEEGKEYFIMELAI
jgi:predicted GNAT family N-acyltransferase